MKKILLAALAALVLCALPTQSSAATRVMVYEGQNPDTNETNIAFRFQRLADGTFLRDVLNTLGTSGAWSGLLITPGSGLFVTVNPRYSAELGAIYQLGPDDATKLPPPPVGQSPYQLPVDNTQIVIQALQSAPSPAIGPLSAPSGSGKAIYYMIEAQLGSVDTANQSILFISQSGVAQYQNVNTERQDIIAYQSKAGSSSTADCNTVFPTPPTVDSGWIDIGLVCVANGVSQVTTGMIAMSGGTNFNGDSFGSISFGGNYAQDNNAPSVLTTHGGILMCGNISVTAGGFAINNPTSTNGGGNLIAGDMNGNLGICGSTLYIDDQQSNSNAAKITVNTSEDTGSAAFETLYPASGTDNNFHVGSGGAACSNASWCLSTNGPETICGKATSATPNGAMITVLNNHYSQLLAETYVPTSGNGVGVTFYNLSGATISSSNLAFNYVCL